MYALTDDPALVPEITTARKLQEADPAAAAVVLEWDPQGRIDPNVLVDSVLWRYCDSKDVVNLPDLYF